MNPNIYIGCRGDILSKDDENQIIKTLNQHGLSGIVKIRRSCVMASLDIFAPVIEFFTSPNLAETLLAGIVPTMLLEGIKAAVKLLWRACRRKPFYELTTKSCRQREPSIQIVVDNHRLVLPEEADEELIEKTMEQFFEAVKQQPKPKEVTYYTLEPNHKRLFYRTYNEIIQDEISKHAANRK